LLFSFISQFSPCFSSVRWFAYIAYIARLQFFINFTHIFHLDIIFFFLFWTLKISILIAQRNIEIFYLNILLRLRNIIWNQNWAISEATIILILTWAVFETFTFNITWTYFGFFIWNLWATLKAFRNFIWVIFDTFILSLIYYAIWIVFDLILIVFIYTIIIKIFIFITIYIYINRIIELRRFDLIILSKIPFFSVIFWLAKIWCS